MTTETKVEAVAWRVRIGDSDMWSYGSEWDVDFHGKQSGLPYVTERLYPQSALDALRGEVERQRQAFYEIEARWVDQMERAEAAERRVAEIHGALRIALASIDETCKEMTIGDRFTNAGQSLIDALPVCRAALTKESP